MVQLDKKLEIFFFGLPHNIKLPFGQNLGQLTAKELRTLYGRCHIGVSVSFSNISLVPYEMIMSGLPVCDFRDGSGPDFFDDDCMIFCDSTPQDFCDKIICHIEDVKALNQLLENAQMSISSNTWEKSAKQFCEYLNMKVF